MDDETFFFGNKPKWWGTDKFKINPDFFKMPKTELEEPVVDIETKAHNVDGFLLDNLVHPRPVELLLTYPFAYFMQLVDCAPFWSPASRLAVGSLIFDQPLIAQGAEDVIFHIHLSDMLLDERTDKIKIMRLSNQAQLYIVIRGEHYKVNDVNRPAREAMERMAERIGLKLEDQVLPLYKFVREVASNGFGMNFNELSRDNVITNDGHRVLLSAEGVLKKEAVKALNNFEGRIENKLAASDIKEMEQHRAWDDE